MQSCAFIVFINAKYHSMYSVPDETHLCKFECFLVFCVDVELSKCLGLVSSTVDSCLRPITDSHSNYVQNARLSAKRCHAA